MKHSASTGAVPKRLFAAVLFNAGLDLERYEYLLDRFVDSLNIPKTAKARTSVRGNIRKELFDSDEMSFRVFLKSLIFLNVTSFEITFAFKDRKGEDTDVKYRHQFQIPELYKDMFFGSDKPIKKTQLRKEELDKIPPEDKILSNIFFQIFNKLKIDDVNGLMDEYIRKTYNKVDPTKISTIRGSIRKDLDNPCMTWKLFIKNISVLGITEFVIGIKLKNTRGREVIAGLPVFLSARNDEDEY